MEKDDVIDKNTTFSPKISEKSSILAQKAKMRN